MATIVTAPDEVAKLHDALLVTPLEAVDELQRLAFRARGLAAKRPNDLMAVLTAALLLARSGQRSKALPLARRAFDMRFGAARLRDEVVAVCTHLALFDEARTAAEEICNKPYAPDDITITNCSRAAFLAGDVALLRRVRDFAPENLTTIHDTLLALIERDNLEPFIPGYMTIINRHISDACCEIIVKVGNFSENDDELTIGVTYHLALSMEECLRLSTDIAEDLVEYYRQFGPDNFRYIHSIVEDFVPMPAVMDDFA
jgi:hypothetical protein